MKLVKLVVVLGFILTYCNGWSQDFSYGLKGGLNINNLDVSPEQDPPKPSARLGFNLGGYAEFDLAENLLIRPELFFSTQGANDEDVEAEQKVKLSYMNLAGLVKYGFNDNVYAFAGPQLGFLIGGEYLEIDKIEREEEIRSATSITKGLDFAFSLGLGYLFNESIGVDVRYNIGLSDINDDPTELGFYDNNQVLKNRSFQISANYYLANKQKK